MWFFPKRAKLPLAEIDHLVFGAVADAIKPAPESFEPVGVIIPVSEPVMPTHLSPEYHAGLAARMIESLDADDARLTDAIAAEISQHETLLAALHAELAGVRKVRLAYTKVGETLADPEPVSSTVKSQRMTRGKRSSEKPQIIVDHAATE